MITLLLAAAIFLPHQTIKLFPPPEDPCVHLWGGDTNNLQNICPDAITVDVAFKNGQGRHFNLDPFESKDIGNKDIPFIASTCYKGEGVASVTADHMHRPGWKDQDKSYVCMQVTLWFDPYTGDK